MTLPGVAVQQHLENRAIAERLDSFATLLELAGANPYSARAYRRAAELIRATEAPVADLVRQGRVRELRGIGRGIEGRLKELVETGEIAELEELEREVSAGSRRPRALPRDRRAPGGADRANARRADGGGAARGGGGGSAARGAGDRAAEGGEAAGGARPRRTSRARRAGCCSTAHGGCSTRSPTPLGGHARRRPAPVPRRRASTSRSSSLRDEADAGAATRSSRCRRSSPCWSAAARRRVRRHGRGRAGRARRRAAGARSAPSSSARPARASTSPRSSRCRRRPTRTSVYRALGIPLRARRSCARRRIRGEPPPLVELAADPRRPALPHDLVGRDGERRVDGAGGDRARLRVPRDLRPHAGGRRGARPDRRRPPPPGARDRGRRTRRSRRSASCAGPSATSSPTGSSTSPTRSSPSSTGCRRASTAASACRSGSRPSGSCGRCGTRYVSCLSHPKGRYINRRPENELDIDRLIEVALEEGRRARGERPARPARPARTSTCARRSRPA